MNDIAVARHKFNTDLEAQDIVLNFASTVLQPPGIATTAACQEAEIRGPKTAVDARICATRL